MKLKTVKQMNPFETVALSLRDLLGNDYVSAVCAARSWFTGESKRALKMVAAERVDLFPQSFQRHLASMLPNVGQRCCQPFKHSAPGATTKAFQANAHLECAPLSGMGYYRIGEDGRLYLISKSEHYHAPLGHGFPGYQLLERARRLGIPNATHNNTRGHITRLLEQEMIRTSAGISPDDSAGLHRLMQSNRSPNLNRVLNLETGSLAVEAALKMILSRFFSPQEGQNPPKYHDRIPVFFVIGDESGGLQANYHGTTILTQLMRGMWPDFLKHIERDRLFLIRTIRPNDTDGLVKMFETYERGRYKIAGVFHELVMMNYGALRLTVPFIRRLYALCKKYDVVTVVDEIQSCVWSPELFLFREYKIQPDMLAVGKGFPGGEFPASRILFKASLDTLPQFGALVTNGQEELSSLTYLITMRWVETNAKAIRSIGDEYEGRLKALASRYPRYIRAIEGKRHLAGIYFHELAAAKAFTNRLNMAGLDISVQTYKQGCPPVSLTKLPLIVGCEAVDWILDHMDKALHAL